MFSCYCVFVPLCYFSHSLCLSILTLSVSLSLLYLSVYPYSICLCLSILTLSVSLSLLSLSLSLLSLSLYPYSLSVSILTLSASLSLLSLSLYPYSLNIYTHNNTLYYIFLRYGFRLITTLKADNYDWPIVAHRSFPLVSCVEPCLGYYVVIRGVIVCTSAVCRLSWRKGDTCRYVVLYIFVY